MTARARRAAPPKPRTVITGLHRCTYRGCTTPATRRLQQSVGGKPWHGCDQHWPAMQSALSVGMPGATSGGSWVDTTVIELAASA